MSLGLRANRSLLTLGHKKTRFVSNRVKPNCYVWCVAKRGGKLVRRVTSSKEDLSTHRRKHVCLDGFGTGWRNPQRLGFI